MAEAKETKNHKEHEMGESLRSEKNFEKKSKKKSKKEEKLIENEKLANLNPQINKKDIELEKDIDKGLEKEQDSNDIDDTTKSSDIKDNDLDINMDNEEVNKEAIGSSEGIVRFPDFSEQNQDSDINKLQAESMGIPEWLTKPKTIDSTISFPITDARFALSKQTLNNCYRENIDEFFAVQVIALPTLKSNYTSIKYHQHVRDVCISAPTGSGKTLAYVIPIVERLQSRVVRRLRALIVLPTRDLVSQVKKVFDKFTRGTEIKVGIASGETSFSKEQANLVETLNFSNRMDDHSKVDVLVCTPGRLIDHISQTPNFTLKHVEFLVMDEADRLLSQGYQDWLNIVYNSFEKHELDSKTENFYQNTKPSKYTDIGDLNNWDSNFILSKAPSRVQKLLFSATLTRDPTLIANLKLSRPVYAAVRSQKILNADSDGIHETPDKLMENYTVCTSYNKPLVLIHLLLTVDVKSVLCFAKSVEAAHRLSQLLELFFKKNIASCDGYNIAEYSSDLSSLQRNQIIKRFKNGSIKILVCSDIFARGIDIDNVSTVINYDVPVSINQYIHRVGRTARAGREGTAYSLVGTHEARHFRQMNHSYGRMEKIKQINIKSVDFEAYTKVYQECLDELKDIYTSRASK
ncbi:hypothetical protein BB558_000076 [Smittium angustum]|uniref:ATP-dependent RNA helicase n=1 Tax=Smittium angustum TaxID=133377 RepID=A0A2U1JFB0_SMIAN|nr:hypothetical protein BB558_000076 [Smittium angustum]